MQPSLLHKTFVQFTLLDSCLRAFVFCYDTEILCALCPFQHMDGAAAPSLRNCSGGTLGAPHPWWLWNFSFPGVGSGTCKDAWLFVSSKSQVEEESRGRKKILKVPQRTTKLVLQTEQQFILQNENIYYQNKFIAKIP